MQLSRCSCSAFPCFVVEGYAYLALQLKAINCISSCVCPVLIGFNLLPTLWDTVKAVIRKRFIAMSAYIKRTERSQISELMLHFKLLEKQEQPKPMFIAMLFIIAKLW
jgi:hypothetical protein